MVIIKDCISVVCLLGLILRLVIQGLCLLILFFFQRTNVKLQLRSIWGTLEGPAVDNSSPSRWALPSPQRAALNIKALHG